MARLNHPVIPRVHVDVPARDVKRWQRSGWVKAPKNVPADSSGDTPTTTSAPRERAATEEE